MTRTKHYNRETGMIIASLDDREQNNTCALHSPMSQQLCSEGQSVSNWHLIELHISIHVPLQHFVTFSSLRFSQSPLIEQSFDEATTGAIKTIRQIEDGITLTYIFVAFCQATCKDNDLLNLFMVCHGEVTCRKTVEWITFVWALTILLVAKQQSGAWCCCFHESKRVKKKKSDKDLHISEFHEAVIYSLDEANASTKEKAS